MSQLRVRLPLRFQFVRTEGAERQILHGRVRDLDERSAEGWPGHKKIPGRAPRAESEECPKDDRIGTASCSPVPSIGSPHAPHADK